MHSKAVVTKPQNVFVMRDVLLNGYVGGGGVQMFSSDPNTFKAQLNARLGMDEDAMADGTIKHMFPIPVHLITVPGRGQRSTACCCG